MSQNTQSFKEKFFSRENNMPSILDAVVILSICISYMFIFGYFFAEKTGFLGNISIQFVIVLLPLFYAKWKNLDIKAMLPFKAPKIRHIFGATFIWFGSFIIMAMLSFPLQKLFPNANDGLEVLADIMKNQSLVVLVFAVAILPAICEEILFRGFTYSAFKFKFAPFVSMLLASILFGIFHLNLIKLFTTALLGLTINYLLYKTENLTISSYVHFINNLLSVFAVKALTASESLSSAVNTQDPMAAFANLPAYAIAIAIAFYLVVAIAFLFLGMFFLKNRPKKV